METGRLMKPLILIPDSEVEAWNWDEEGSSRHGLRVRRSMADPTSAKLQKDTARGSRIRRYGVRDLPKPRRDAASCGVSLCPGSLRTGRLVRAASPVADGPTSPRRAGIPAIG